MLARDVAAHILQITEGLERDPRFAFVQFHPSYNYEDFVRGIRVETVDGQVVYKTENRIFGEMAEAARNEKCVLVIDEINRANVSAVLGELIYGLEYRGKEVQTPYKVDGNTGLLIPENLQIIGTMNTADRTIGQIDYAVRRRFAFVHCPPDKQVVQQVGGARALEFFEMVDKVFTHLSADHDKEDVCIGHSYFLADGVALANKIIYQVVPILREYLKDGVLTKEANTEIDVIEKNAGNIEVSSLLPLTAATEGKAWMWEHKNAGESWGGKSLRQTILSLVTNYAVRENVANLAELQEAFPNDCAYYHAVVLDKDDERVKPDRYFTRKPIELGDGTLAVVCSGWATQGAAAPHFNRFKERAKILGYELTKMNPNMLAAFKASLRKTSVRKR